MVSSSGGCYGFAVDAAIELAYLRHSGSLEGLRVLIDEFDQKPAIGEVILDWPARPHRPAAVRLHEDPLGYALWISDAGWFRIDTDQLAISLPMTSATLRTEERLWGMPSLLAFMSLGDMPLHAGGVEIDGHALLYTAPSRFGKTTLSAALWAAGHRLLTEDLSRVQIGDHPHVLPGPAMLRLRHDMARRLDVPNTIEVGADADRVHLSLAPDRRGHSHPVPIAGIVILREGDQTRLTPVEPAEAMRDLWAVTFHLPDREATVFSQLADLVARVPVWNLHRPLRLDGLDATVATLVEARSAAS